MNVSETPFNDLLNGTTTNSMQKNTRSFLLEYKLLIIASKSGKRKKIISRQNPIKFQKNDFVELHLSSCVDS